MVLKSWDEVKILNESNKDSIVTEKLSKLMNDFEGNLFKYSHKGITLNDYNKMKKSIAGEEKELEGSNEDGLEVSIEKDDNHILTFDEFEGIIYSNYIVKDLLKWK